MDMHAIIGTIAERVPTVPDPTDYVGDDGLIYCGHCNVAKETILDFGFMKRKVWCICNCGMQMERPCLVTSFTRIAHKLNDQRYGKQDYLDNLNTFDLLVIDDLGAEEYMQEIVFDVINTRYNSGKPFIITTNLTIEEIKKPAELSNARIYDRILERCTPIEANGASRRRIKAANDYYETQKKLGLI